MGLDDIEYRLHTNQTITWLFQIHSISHRSKTICENVSRKKGRKSRSQSISMVTLSKHRTKIRSTRGFLSNQIQFNGDNVQIKRSHSIEWRTFCTPPQTKARRKKLAVLFRHGVRLMNENWFGSIKKNSSPNFSNINLRWKQSEQSKKVRKCRPTFHRRQRAYAREWRSVIVMAFEAHHSNRPILICACVSFCIIWRQRKNEPSQYINLFVWCNLCFSLSVRYTYDCVETGNCCARQKIATFYVKKFCVCVCVMSRCRYKHWNDDTSTTLGDHETHFSSLCCYLLAAAAFAPGAERRSEEKNNEKVNFLFGVFRLYRLYYLHHFVMAVRFFVCCCHRLPPLV